MHALSRQGATSRAILEAFLICAGIAEMVREPMMREAREDVAIKRPI